MEPDKNERAEMREYEQLETLILQQLDVIPFSLFPPDLSSLHKDFERFQELHERYKMEPPFSTTEIAQRYIAYTFNP